MLDARGRGALVPSSAIPLAYFAAAHVCLAAALAALAVRPDLPGGFFYHPRMIALVHLLTLGWISGSILGAFYIVAPLALVTPLPAGWKDWAGFAAFSTGTLGMVSHFWLGTYDGMAWSAGLVMAAIVHLGWRAMRGLARAAVPGAVALHVRLAFVNITVAGILGIIIGLDRARGFLGLSPIAATYAHAHLAALGWAGMMVMGLAYRLVPMMLPSAMPSGRGLAVSAVLMESGLAVLVCSLLFGWPLVPAGAVLIACALAAFVRQLARAALRRVPRPPALPGRDWSILQVQTALLWLVAASGMGLVLAAGGYGGRRDALAWVYGTAGLVGFLAQIIVGMQGRLVPYYAWYRAMAARAGKRPRRSANALPSAAFARAIFVAWLAGVPLLAWGLPARNLAAIRVSALLLLTGLVLQTAHLVYMLYRVRTPTDASRALRGTHGRRAARAAGVEPRSDGCGA